MSFSSKEVDTVEEGTSESANNLAVKYIIPVSVIVGVFLAASLSSGSGAPFRLL